MRIGVLALQGAFKEHCVMLMQLGVEPVEIRKPSELAEVNGLIIPGGESTAIGKLMRDYDFLDPIKEAHKKGMPIWGTCAGMILMAQDIGDEQSHLGIMDIKVKRNAFGRQLDSFSSMERVVKVSEFPIPLTFIRAPIVEKVGKDVEVLHKTNGAIVAARDNKCLVTSFHPELTNDLSWHKYFLGMV